MKEKKPDKNNIGVLSWIINVILLSAFWPAGVILLIMRLSGNVVHLRRNGGENVAEEIQQTGAHGHRAIV